MACNEFENLLERSLEGGLDSQEQKLLDKHLETCAACRFRLTSIKDLRSLNEGEEVPEAFSAAWRNKIKMEQPAPIRRLPQATRWVAMAATLVLLLLGAYKAGDLDLLGIRNAAPDKSAGARTAMMEREAPPMDMSPPGLTADTVMESEKMADFSLDMSEEADAAIVFSPLPTPAAETRESLPADQTADNESRLLSFLHDNLIYLMSFAALVLLILLIHEKRKHK
ncbi:MAG: zf-HC2 domain-containing protein [Bacillota bacterium]|nr:zf-HC2 domain-containing protein [Bacillota bacterium]